MGTREVEQPHERRARGPENRHSGPRARVMPGPPGLGRGRGCLARVQPSGRSLRRQDGGCDPVQSPEPPACCSNPRTDCGVSGHLRQWRSGAGAVGGVAGLVEEGGLGPVRADGRALGPQKPSRPREAVPARSCALILAVRGRGAGPRRLLRRQGARARRRRRGHSVPGAPPPRAGRIAGCLQHQWLRLAPSGAFPPHPTVLNATGSGGCRAPRRRKHLETDEGAPRPSRASRRGVLSSPWGCPGRLGDALDVPAPPRPAQRAAPAARRVGSPASMGL